MYAGANHCGTRWFPAAAKVTKVPVQERSGLKPNDWLLSAEDDEAGFRLIHRQFRGFDQPMS